MILIRHTHDARNAYRRFRADAGVTAAQLAEQLHITPERVYDRERGVGLGIDDLAAIGDFAGYDLALLPRRGGASSCCEHCRRVAAIIDERRAHRIRVIIPTPFSTLFDLIAKAMGRPA
ncbi:helix-turn-helix domain-containing protein [Actinoplanes siamensis]|uniref:Helix-turn-helix protein n=1 Tax=Actinoplanes siamensis TaxID=1223317 RepID=A0A919TP93_9ACTN|nr:helix-turn-helix transcriptional regulator [Actinoplanes siamensis]GIF08680.1 hypothetical protein Asi03nite_62180 [Actinoplanes siamensis]